MKHRAFSLMELMIVIVIIGILAAGSLVIFGDKGEKAKIAVTKANHKSVVKFIAYELMQCNMGETSVMSGNLTCSGRTVQKAITASVNALSDLKNPYGEPNKGVHDKDDKAVTDGGSYSSDHGVGYVRLQTFSAKVIRIGTCYAIPCWVNKNNYNYFESDVNVVK